MKTFGKITLVAGLATALIVLLRKRKDGTRLLDDLTHQVSSWANMLMKTKEDLGMANGQATSSTIGKSTPRTALKTTAGGQGTRQPGDIQE
jgi:hypothetical protein